MKKLLLLLALPVVWAPTYAQFTKAIKDSVVAQLEYPTSKYTVTLTMSAEDYVPTPDQELYKLTKPQLLGKLQGNNKDAVIYSVLFSKAYFGEKNQEEGDRYLNEAVKRYESWINETPEDPVPAERLLGLLIYSKNYQLVPDLLTYALPRFPQSLLLRHHAAYYYLDIKREFDKCQQYIDEALQLDAANAKALLHQVMLYQYQFITAMSGNDSTLKEVPRIPALDNALRRHPDSAIYTHIEYYRQLSDIYFKGMSRFFAADTDALNVFDHFQLTPAELATAAKAEKWFLQRVAQKKNNAATLLNTLGVIACMQKKYEEAYGHFKKAYELDKANNSNESVIIILLLLEKYPELAAVLEEKVARDQDPADYGSLLKLHRKYLKNEDAEKRVLAQLAAHPMNHGVKNQVLSTGYMLTGQTTAYQGLVPQLGETTITSLLLKTTAAVLADDKEAARSYLQKGLELDPGNPEVMKVKALTGL